MLTAAVLSSDAAFRDAVPKVLAGVDVYARSCDSVKQFDAWFAPGYRAAFDANQPPIRRPDALIVDLGTDDPSKANLAFVEAVLGADVGTEMIAVVDGEDLDRDSRLLENGVASIVRKSEWHAAESGLAEMTRRLAKIFRERAAFRLRKSLGTPHPPSPRRDRAVFLCHAINEVKLSFGIQRLLESRGLQTWYSEVDVTSSDAWRAQAFDALDQARVLVPIINQKWLASGNCAAEFIRFCERSTTHSGAQRVIVPLITEPAVLAQERVERLVARWPGPDSSLKLWAKVEALTDQLLRQLGRNGSSPPT